MRLIDADALKDEKFYSHERHENCVSVYAIDMMPTIEPDRPHGKWEYLKEHITEMRDADGELNQKDTCQFILNLMGVIEREGDEK